MSASFDSNHFTKLGELYDFLTGIWNKCKNKFAAKSDLATVATSGSYNDLSDKPTIPSVPVTDVTVDGTSVVSNGTAAITMPTVDQVYDETSANAQSGVAMAGALANKQDNMVVLEYGTSTWNDFIMAYNKNAVVYCKYAVNAANSRLAHLAFVNLTTTDANKNAEFWFVRSISTHTGSVQCDEVMIYKLTFNGTWSTTTRKMCLQGIAGNGITRTVTESAGAGTIAWSVKPKTNGGIGVDSNGVYIDNETVLWSGTYTGSIDPTNYITLSEAASHFSKIQVEMESGDVYTYNGSVSSFRTRYAGADKANNRIQNVDATFTVSGTTVTCTANIIYKVTSSGISDYYNMSSIDYNPEARPVKIVGIKRIASN